MQLMKYEVLRFNQWHKEEKEMVWEIKNITYEIK